MSSVANPYASTDLYMPEQLHATILQFTGAGKPFSRQIDAWWLGLCVGVRHGEKRPRSEKRTKFMDGTILASDPWRIVHLELLALAEEGKEILSQPSKVITLASGYVDYGLEWITKQCLGATEPTLALMNALDVSAL